MSSDDWVREKAPGAGDEGGAEKTGPHDDWRGNKEKRLHTGMGRFMRIFLFLAPRRSPSFGGVWHCLPVDQRPAQLQYIRPWIA